MKNLFQTTPKTTFSPKYTAGFTLAKLHAINPTNEQYEKIVGKPSPYNLDYAAKNGGVYIRCLVEYQLPHLAEPSFGFLDTMPLSNELSVSAKSGTSQFVNAKLQTCWANTELEAVAQTWNDGKLKLDEGVKIYPATVGMESFGRVMKVALGLAYTADVFEFMKEGECFSNPEDITTFDFEAFNNQFPGKEVVVCLYSYEQMNGDKTNVYTNLLKNTLYSTWKFEQNLPFYAKAAQKLVEGDSYAKPNAFYHFGALTTQTTKDPVAKVEEADDLPF